jgi:hypothetical protein
MAIKTKPPTDQDGKSKTASAIDAESYPEQDEVEDSGRISAPTHEEIAARAQEIWESRGCPDGTAALDWEEAEAELRERHSRKDLDRGRQQTGSVQR